SPADGVGSFGLYNGIAAERFAGINWARYSSGGSGTIFDQAGRAYPHELTYAQLRQIVALFRQEGQARGLDVRILDGVDAGPEFSSQEWKYAAHPEALLRLPSNAFYGGSESLGVLGFEASLNPDGYPYAAYPGGIPASPRPTVYEFVARQVGRYVADLGLDGIYATNGYGTPNQWRPLASPG